ncbi:DUF4398 domain-containing protein [Solimonas sp. K1W22B-7]|uniref:DUF4398 domain-containing protein n=1 Tax=Solimonas sp. K1W22B-7 TaxID=2303331 RepID=UPI000E337431|nr:DUF4398 domain-containing protein [Solimonas sp. K1W22B-7]AXQ30272.1 DUF4398 domain-containing protein [Solimonas sp. K1W22B-7]
MRRALTAILLAALAACASAPKTSPELDALRAQLEKLENDPQLGGLAPVAMVEADRAIDAAVVSLTTGDGQLEQKLYLAGSRVAIARAHAQRRSVENRIRALSKVQEQAVPVSQEVEGVIAIPPPELRPEPVAPKAPELPPQAPRETPRKSALPPPP